MKIRQAVARVTDIFAENGIESAMLESEVLARCALDVSRAGLYTMLDRDIEPIVYRLLLDYAGRRLSGEPSAYITGHKEFYGLDLFVDKRVLIPRPETELMVERARELLAGSSSPVIADIGTGSGCVTLALAKTIPGSFVYALDKSSECLEVASLNCARHAVEGRVRLLEGDLLAPLPERVDIITANLPYVKSKEITPGNPEPRLALDGGKDGLTQIRRLVRQAPAYMKYGASLLLEIGQGQQGRVTDFIRETFKGARISCFRDLAAIDRLVVVSLEAAPVSA